MKTKLKEGEEVALVVRQHTIVLFTSLLITIAFIAAGVLILYAGWLPGGIILPAAGLLFFLYKYYQRRNNLWAVTNFRVIDEFGVISLNAKESPLDKINNVSYSQSIWGRMLGFGDVQIQTAAEMGATTYRMVEQPGLLKDTVTSMQEKFRNYQFARQAEAFTGNKGSAPSAGIAEEIEKLHSLMVKGIISEEDFLKKKRQMLEG